MRALGDALAAQEEGLDPERLSRTYAALMAELQEAAGDGRARGVADAGHTGACAARGRRGGGGGRGGR